MSIEQMEEHSNLQQASSIRAHPSDAREATQVRFGKYHHLPNCSNTSAIFVRDAPVSVEL